MGYITGGDGDGGGGNVIGPASAVDNNLAAFDSISGELIKDSGFSVLDIFGGITKTVNSGADLPTAVAGVRTLADGTRYVIAGAIDIGSDRIEYGTNSELCGYNSSISSITSTTAGALLTANLKFLRVAQMSLNCPNGDLFDFTGTASAAYIIDNIVSLSHINIGSFANVNSGLISICSFVGSVNGITFSGTGTGNSSIKEVRFLSYSGTAIDFGTAVLNTTSLNTVIFNGLAGSISLDGAAASANLTTRGIVVGCTFNGDGSRLASIDVNDLKWIFRGNFGLPDSTADAGFSVSGNATVTDISAAGADTTIKVDVGVLATFYLDNRFTVATNGTATYNGLENLDLKISYSVFADTGSGSNNNYAFYVAKNNTVVSGSRIPRSFDAADPASPGLVQAVVPLVTGDFIDLFVEGIGQSTDITISDYTCVIE